MTEITTGPGAKKKKAAVALCKKLPSTATKDERAAAHKIKMSEKAERRAAIHDSLTGRIRVTSANINRRTGKPHEHKREIARRLRQGRV